MANIVFYTFVDVYRVPAKRAGPQSASLRHKQELERMILEQKNASASDSGFEDKGMESDEAVEMLGKPLINSLQLSYSNFYGMF